MTRPLSPNDARLIIETVVLPSFQREHDTTRRCIRSIPDQMLDYRPATGARTAGELARHIAAVELSFLSGAITGEFGDFGTELARVGGAAEIADLYVARFGTAIDLLAGLSGEELLVDADYKGVVKMPRLGFVQFALYHTIHHRGQLSVYYRSAGVAMPPIYG